MESKDNEAEKLKPLSGKEQAFCEQYTVDWNKTRAAQRAGYSPDNPAAAAVSANRLLKKANVNAYIEECKKDTERLAGISRLRNAKELANIAYSSIAHLHDTWVETKYFEDLTEEQKSAIESIERKTRTIEREGDTDIEIEYVKIKLFNKLAALDAIAKMYGYYEPERMKIDADLRASVAPMTPQEAKAFLDGIAKDI